MNRTINFAHRGFTKQYPDNTLEAFQAVIELGIEAIECDVYETADHHFVVYHDSELEGIALDELSLREIIKTKIAGCFHIPTLVESLYLCHGRIRVMLEVKRIVSLGIFLGIVNAITDPSEVFIASFYRNTIQNLVNLTHRVPFGILTSFAVQEPLKIMSLTGATIMLPRFTDTNLELVHNLHDHNYSIIIWECNHKPDQESALSWRVDGIITDSPDVLLEHIY